MSQQLKIAVLIGSLVFTAALALAGAIPYGYFLLALAGGTGNAFAAPLCWALYGFVAVLLWLALWRATTSVIIHWPGRRG
jgi:hypothetical protein